MRIVGGTARGRPLVAPPGDRTRPTSDRVREAVFNALWSRGALDGARAVDLFAGSGALGIEALSRGAAHVTFVDSDRAARRAIERNLAACGVADRADGRRHPRRALAGRPRPAAGSTWPSAIRPTPTTAGTPCWPPSRADLAVVESDRPLPLPAGWDLAAEARYGGTWVGFATPSGPGGTGFPTRGELP